MSIISVGSGADILGAAAQIAQGTTASDASINVLKTAVDTEASTAAGLASLVAETTGASNSLLNVYA